MCMHDSKQFDLNETQQEPASWPRIYDFEVRQIERQERRKERSVRSSSVLSLSCKRAPNVSVTTLSVVQRSTFIVHTGYVITLSIVLN